MKRFINKFMEKKVLFLIPIVLVLMIVVPNVMKLGISSMSILITILLYMYWASSWNIMGGYTGLFSLGNGIYIGLGAYITACLFTYGGITPYIGIPIAGVLTGLFSIAIAFPTFRLQSVFYSLATSALLKAMQIIFLNFKTIFGLQTGGADGFKIRPGNNPANMQFVSKFPYYYIVLGMLVIVLLVSYYLSVTKSGYYFRAISANPGAASSLGVDVFSMKVKAQFISAFFTAMGGGFYCMFINYISPASLFGGGMSINIMMMAVVGGANTLWGPVLGAGIMYTLNRLITMNAPSSLNGIADLIFGVILMLCVFFMPNGILHYLKIGQSKLQAARMKTSAEKN